MVAFRVRRPVAALALFMTLGGCGTSYQVGNAIDLPPQALADEVHLRRSPATLNGNADRRYSQRFPAGEINRHVVNRHVVRPMTIERTETKLVTTGQRNSERADDGKSFKPWLDNQRSEEVRINSNLTICKGC